VRSEQQSLLAWQVSLFFRQDEQMEPRQARPSQQGAPELHLPPLGRQHLPPAQIPLQQSVLAVQAAPAATHVARVQVPPWQVRLLQHSFASLHGWPLSVQVQASAEQRPRQQSRSALHAEPAPVQAQPLFEHVPRQQGRDELHDALAEAHARHKLSVQTVPEQHVLVPPHSLLAVAQMGRQTEPLHSSPAQQGSPPVHDAPSVPQPEVHLRGQSDERLFGSLVGRSTQARLSQQSRDTAQLSLLVLHRGEAQRPASHPHEQQSPSTAQAWPLGRQPGAQAPAVHLRPLQHAPSLLQGKSWGQHVQAPKRQSPEQQSDAWVQV
jgi:hypothetical protein